MDYITQGAQYMKEITINCADVANEAALYALLAKSLDFPDPDADHLDDLYDHLTEISQETHLTIFGLDGLEFADNFRSTLLNAETDNFWLNISIQ